MLDERRKNFTAEIVSLMDLHDQVNGTQVEKFHWGLNNYVERKENALTKTVTRNISDMMEQSDHYCFNNGNGKKASQLLESRVFASSYSYKKGSFGAFKAQPDNIDRSI